MKNKVRSMKDAVAELVHDGDTVVIEGFTHLICFADQSLDCTTQRAQQLIGHQMEAARAGLQSYLFL